MRKIGLTGIILKGRYCILEQIGQGGQGSLYLARDLELGTLWAVKEIPQERKKEAKLMQLLEHPSLPKMVDYAERGEFCYLVMEFIRGKSLGQWLSEGRIFSFAEILKIGMETSEVLEYLHTRKPPVYYGDFKPDNLMLTESGRLYFVDFGSAVLGYSDRKRVCLGTAGYAAPEQYEGRVTAASDVYAWGKTMSVLCGKNKKRYFIQNPGFGILLRRCCRKEEELRCSDMAAVRKQLSSLPEKERRIKKWSFIVLSMAFLLAVPGVLLMTGTSGKPAFEEALSAVTDQYYEDAFSDGSIGTIRKVCAESEQELQTLLKEYPEKECQRKLLLLLALNGELQGEDEHAAVYYEQLLLYDAEFGDAYGEYGLFLCRKGLEEESRKLWERYCRAEENGALEQMDQKRLEDWRERLDEENENETEITEKAEKKKLS